jgi:TatD DNase family protein
MCDSASGRRIIMKIPRERLLTESDGPFVSFEQNSVRPGDIGVLVRRIAELRGEPTTTLQDMIFTNFREIMRRVPGQASEESGVGS